MEHSPRDVVKRLAYRLYEEFEKMGMTDDAKSNWQVADSIVKHIVDGSYRPEEWATFIPESDMRILLELKRQDDNRRGSSRSHPRDTAN
jgi:hypothetical protein